LLRRAAKTDLDQGGFEISISWVSAGVLGLGLGLSTLPSSKAGTHANEVSRERRCKVADACDDEDAVITRNLNSCKRGETVRAAASVIICQTRIWMYALGIPNLCTYASDNEYQSLEAQTPRLGGIEAGMTRYVIGTRSAGPRGLPM
jgi:hypothetical protein